MAGYTRNDTANNIADGNIINASDLDGEFDAVQGAFDNTTGHTHDGTAGEGAPIEKVGPAQDVVVTATAMRPKTDNTVDLGTSLLEYKDLFIDGTANIDTLSVDEDASITGTLTVTSTSTFSDDVTVETDLLLNTDSSNIYFGVDSEIVATHVPDTGLILGNANTAPANPFVLNLKSNESTLTADDAIGTINFSTNPVAGGVGAGVQASITVDATDTYSATVAGSRMEFYTTDTAGTNTRAMYIDDDQTVTFESDIDVTGTVTADGLTVGAASLPKITLSDTDGGFDDVSFTVINGGRDLQIVSPQEVIIKDAGTAANWLRIDEGDISFYEDTGTTAKFFWDASAESLGIGTTSPSSPLTVNKDTGAGGYAIALMRNDASASNGNGILVDVTNTPQAYVADFRIGNSSKVRIDSSGNVGIGTSSPSYKLHVDADTNSVFRLGTTGGGALNVTVDDYTVAAPTWRIQSGASEPISFAISASEAMRIDSSGNVGIGTSSPASNLHVESTGSTGFRLIGSTTGANTIYMGDTASGSAGYIQYSNNSDYMRVATGGTERMRIDSNGNVGIGTSSPQVQLETFGSAQTYNFNAGTDPLANLAVINDNANSGTGPAIVLGSVYQGSAAVANARIFAERQSTGSVNAGATDLIFEVGQASGSALAERLRIDSSGNVGIGTSSPDGNLTVGDTSTSGDVSIRIKGDATSRGFLMFGDSGGAQLGDIMYDHSDNHMRVRVNNSERMRIDSSGNVGIGTTSPDAQLDIESATQAVIRLNHTGSNYWELQNDSNLKFNRGGTERMRIDSSGNLLLGTTTVGLTTESIVLRERGEAYITSDGRAPLLVNRLTSGGDIVQFRRDGDVIGAIGNPSSASRLSIYGDNGSTGAGLYFGNAIVLPTDRLGVINDNVNDFGTLNYRWDDIFATNGTIQTSDQNEKQQIADLTAAEMQAAKAISKLFKTFKWNDSVTEKGDAARTHTGVIAQEVEAAMSAAGLDAGKYAFFISSTWWETQTEVPAVEAVAAQDAVYEDVIIPAIEEVLDEEGNVITEAQPERTEQRLVSEAVEGVEAREAYTRTDTYDTLEEAPEGAVERNRKGIRYPQLLSFIGAATEQRLASIEARLDALEG